MVWRASGQWGERRRRGSCTHPRLEGPPPPAWAEGGAAPYGPGNHRLTSARPRHADSVSGWPLPPPRLRQTGRDSPPPPPRAGRGGGGGGGAATLAAAAAAARAVRRCRGGPPAATYGAADRDWLGRGRWCRAAAEGGNPTGPGTRCVCGRAGYGQSGLQDFVLELVRGASGMACGRRKCGRVRLARVAPIVENTSRNCDRHQVRGVPVRSVGLL